MSSITTTSGLVGRGRLDQAADAPERLLHRAGGPDADEPREHVDDPVAIAVARRRASAPIAARAASASRSSVSPAASRISCATGAKVASPARSHRSSTRLRAGVLGQARAQLAREAGLADAGGAEHGHEAGARGRGARVVEHADEPLHLRVAADERRRGLGLDVGLDRDLVDRDGLGAPGDGHLAERLVRDVAAGEAPRLLADEHVAGPARLLEPGRDVERVADEVGVAFADHDLAGVDADPQRQRLAVPALDVGRELLEPLLERDARGDGAAGVVLGDLGDAERRHHPVAHELGDGARVRVDRLLEQRVVAGEHLTRDLGVGALAEAGGAAEVGEEDGDRLADRTRRAGDAGEGPSVSAVPHSPQNFCPGCTSAWQPGHRSASGFPHSTQNRVPSRFSKPQLAHAIADCPRCSDPAKA